MGKGIKNLGTKDTLNKMGKGLKTFGKATKDKVNNIKTDKIKQKMSSLTNYYKYLFIEFLYLYCNPCICFA